MGIIYLQPLNCISTKAKMVVVAQLVRASVCGTEGRRFEPGLPPNLKDSLDNSESFCFMLI